MRNSFTHAFLVSNNLCATDLAHANFWRCQQTFENKKFVDITAHVLCYYLK